MEKEVELKPCPFCGSEACVGVEGMTTYWSVGCRKCFCFFARYFNTKEEAIEKWNKRNENDKS